MHVLHEAIRISFVVPEGLLGKHIASSMRPFVPLRHNRGTYARDSKVIAHATLDASIFVVLKAARARNDDEVEISGCRSSNALEGSAHTRR